MQFNKFSFINLKLSNASSQGPSFNDIEIRYSFTTRGILGLSPYTNIKAQLILGYNPISLLEVVSIINLLNISTYYLHFYPDNCLPKYNPYVIIGKTNSVGNGWLYDRTSQKTWPEIL